MRNLKVYLIVIFSICLYTVSSFGQVKIQDNSIFSSQNSYSLEFNKKLAVDSKDFDPAFFEEWLGMIMESEMIPGMTLCFLKDGNLYWRKNLGYANLEQGIPVGDSTQFLTCSISKTVVVTAAMQLYEQELFDLDDDINNYLPFEVRNPNFPDSIITFRHLMTHTSSITDDLNLLQQLSTYGYDCPISLEDFLTGYLTEGGEYYSQSNYSEIPPQQEFNYSNVGVSLLAYIVEQISGTDFETYCQYNIFQPLNMTETSFRLSNLNQDLIATPYQFEDEQLFPLPHMGFPVYPAGSMRTSSIQLARFLGMYMKNGMFNGTRILEESTIDLITTRQYPDLIMDKPIGLIWFRDFFFYDHGGSCPGALSNFGFSFSKKSGVITMINSNNPFMTEFMEFLLYYYALEYEPFTIKSISINDNDNDNVLEPFEEVELIVEVRNNMNIKEQISNVNLSLETDDPNITLEMTQSFLGDLEYLEKKENTDSPFVFVVGENNSSSNSSFDFTVVWEEESDYDLGFELFIGDADILLVNDASSFGGDFLKINYWYEFILDSLGYTHHDYSTSLYGAPTYELLSNFPVVIWYCGYDNVTSLTESDQEILSEYLDNGGKLFLTGQGISEDISESDFLMNYLHAKHISDSFTGEEWLRGKKDDPIGQGMNLQVNQGWDALYQSSMSVIEPVGGAEEIFYYSSTDSCAAVRYGNGNYKTVFFGFGFEGINNYDVRLELMDRILNYLYSTVDVEEVPTDNIISHVKVYPNPFSSQAVISFKLNEPGDVEFALFDLQGKVMQRINKINVSKGSHHFLIDGKNLSPGVYLYGIKSGEFVRSDKVIHSR